MTMFKIVSLKGFEPKTSWVMRLLIFDGPARVIRRRRRRHVEPDVVPGQPQVDVDGDGGVGLDDVGHVVDADVDVDDDWTTCKVAV